jgi:hypothetical protein
LGACLQLGRVAGRELVVSLLAGRQFGADLLQRRADGLKVLLHCRRRLACGLKLFCMAHLQLGDSLICFGLELFRQPSREVLDGVA